MRNGKIVGPTPAETRGLDDESTMREKRTRTAEDWNLTLVATSEALPARMLEGLSSAVVACGGWVLSHGAVSESCADIDFEFPRAQCMEIYSLLVATGVELSQEAHQQLTGLCHCTRQLGARQLDHGEESAAARVHLSVYAGDGAEGFLGESMGAMREAA